MPTLYPILENKRYEAPSVFTAENLLREARRQKSLLDTPIPAVCILDPDGDFAQFLLTSGRGHLHPNWACYHTKLIVFTSVGMEFGVIPYAVGAAFAVLVAEELFASGCQLLISITSAGQIVPAGQPPYFVLIDRALRDEGTSYHYTPPSRYSHINSALLTHLDGTFETTKIRVLKGATWTTDAPFRETEAAIAYAQSEGILGVEMEAAALYALAQAKAKAIICFAHITNLMAQIEGDFEKGVDNGSHDALEIISLTAQRWLNR
jgi:uridine phosphorylase